MTRPARALIDIPALRHNFQQVRKAAPGRKILAVVKADAYGHGVQRVARALDDADGFAVAGPRFENYIPDDFSGGYYS